MKMCVVIDLEVNSTEILSMMFVFFLCEQTKLSNIPFTGPGLGDDLPSRPSPFELFSL
jgi:hypothetical protein